MIGHVTAYHFVSELNSRRGSPNAGLAKWLELTAKNCRVVVTANDNPRGATGPPSLPVSIPPDLCIARGAGIRCYVVGRISRYRICLAGRCASSIHFPHTGLARGPLTTAQQVSRLPSALGGYVDSRGCFTLLAINRVVV